MQQESRRTWQDHFVLWASMLVSALQALWDAFAIFLASPAKGVGQALWDGQCTGAAKEVLGKREGNRAIFYDIVTG